MVRTPEIEAGILSLSSQPQSSDVLPFRRELRRAVADLVLDTTSDGVWLIDEQARTTFVNRRVARLLGYSVDEMVGISIFALMDDEGREMAAEKLARRRSGVEEQYEFKCRRKDGSPVWVLVTANPVYDRAGAYAGALAMVADLSEQKAREHALARRIGELEHLLAESEKETAAARASIESLAYRDALTGLYNRRYFDERLAQEADRCRRHARLLCLLFMDLDGFKRLNDRHGHLAGDEALRGLGRVLGGPASGGERSLLRSSDVAARYGGDEIAILAPETSLEGGHVLAERLLERVRGAPLAVPEGLEGKPLSLGISIGLAACPLHASAPTELIASADRAMYQAKRQGGGRVCLAGSSLGA